MSAPLNVTVATEADAGVLARHQALLNAGRFVIQRCGSCKSAVYYPRELCPHCGSDELRWEEPSGGGTVYALTTVARKPDAGGDYTLCLVDLDEGVRLMARLEGVNASRLRIGQRVQTRLAHVQGQALVVCEPAEEGA